jgi:hypothetical protein
MEDEASILRVERSLRAGIYGPSITEALKQGVQSLTDSERRLLLLRYEDELRVSEIDSLLGVSSVCITRRIQVIQVKLRERIVAALRRQGLVQAAVGECSTEVLENGAYSILPLVKPPST